MFAPSAYQQRAATTGTTALIVVEIVILVCGLVMTYKAYLRRHPIAAAKRGVLNNAVEHTDK
jgi:hypothetical protein